MRAAIFLIFLILGQPLLGQQIPNLTGRLFFDDFQTTFTPGLRNLLSDVEPSRVGGVAATATLNLASQAGRVPGAPDHRFGGPIQIEILDNGDARATSFSAAAFTGQGPDRETRNGVTYRRSLVLLNPNEGAIAEGIEVYLPAGFAVSQTAGSRYREGRVVVSNVPLGEGLIPESISLTKSDFFPGSTGLIYPSADRIPVRFATNEIVWNGSDGTFTFQQDASEVLQQKDEIQLLLLILAGTRDLPGAAALASNYYYFLGAREAIAPIVIGARVGGAATLSQVHMTLDPTKFGQVFLQFRSHFPELSLSWSGAADSRIHYTGNNIDLNQSQLTGVAFATMNYARGVAPIDCNGDEGNTVDDEAIFASPIDGRWGFTPDGGLRAQCVLRDNFLAPPGIDIEWGGYLAEGGGDRFAHQVVTPFSEGFLMTAGIHTRNNLLTVAQHLKPAALALSGHGDGFSERPETQGYEENGLADYPGINLRCDDECMAQSRLAGQLIEPAYPLLSTSKYYLRPGGLSGLHLSAATDPITFTAYCGADFELTALNLSFLDGENIDSGVNGLLGIPEPANFDLEFEKLVFGAQGQLQTAGIAPGQENPTLEAWAFEFEPLGLEFPQPKRCEPPVQPDEGFPQITSSAEIRTLTNEPLVGPLGFCFGNLLAESDSEAGGNAPISRFATASNLTINGPNGEMWQVNPMTGVSLNKHQGGNWSGNVSVGGLMDLPFFEDLSVVLHSDSVNTGGFSPVRFVRRPWEDLTMPVFDFGHRGLPPAVNQEAYRTALTWDPEVHREWQLGVNFTLPVTMGSDGVFRASEVDQGDVFLFRLSKSVKRITPSTAEITFDGDLELSLQNLVAQVNVNSLLAGLNLNLSGIAQQGVEGALSGVTNLDDLLEDQLQGLLEPALAELVGGTIGQAQLDALAQAAPAARPAMIDGYLASLSAGIEGLPANGWLDTMRAKVQDARTGVEQLLELVDNVDATIALANAISQAVGSSELASEDALDDALEPVRSLLQQVVNQLQEVEQVLTPDQIGMLLAAELGIPTTEVQLALDDLKNTWAPSGNAFFNGVTLEQFQADLVSALSDRLGASDFTAGALTLLRQYLGDPQGLARKAIDDTLRTLENSVTQALAEAAGSAEALGDALGGFMAAARLRGYALINGDSLHEIRLDGRAELTLSEEMQITVDAYYHFRNLESATPGATPPDAVDQCLIAGGATAEIAMGAAATAKWGDVDVGASLEAKIAMGESGRPVGMSGDFGLTGNIGVGDISISDIKLGIGAGANNAYVYGRGTGTLKNITITAGFFGGMTCDPSVIENADPQIGELIENEDLSLPVIGVVGYAEGGLSLQSIIGIPASCVFDLKAHGGQGFFVLFERDGPKKCGGYKVLYGVSGRLLCLVNVRGDMIGTVKAAAEVSISGNDVNFGGVSLSGSATARVKGDIGPCPFCISFERSVRLLLFAEALFDNAQFTGYDYGYDIDY